VDVDLIRENIEKGKKNAQKQEKIPF